MPKKGENIYKRKDGRWEGRYIRFYHASGKAKYGYVYGKTYTEARKKLLDRQIAERTRNMQEVQHIQYNNILDSWISSAKLKVKESTIANYSRLINCHIRPALGHYDIDKISTELLEQYTGYLLSSGRLDHKGGLSPKTVSDILMILKRTLEYAIYHGFSVGCNISKLSVKKPTREMRVLSISEQNALSKVLLYNTTLSKLGTLISLYTGIRIGELCALRWENISLDDNVIRIRYTLQRIQDIAPNASKKTKIICTEPKSKQSIRDIPIPHWLVELITPFQSDPMAYFLTGCSWAWLEPRTMQNHFKKYVTEASIDQANFHALRHTFATRCIELGFDVKTLSEILGHTSVNITLNRYVHTSMEQKSNQMAKLSLLV